MFWHFVEIMDLYVCISSAVGKHWNVRANSNKSYSPFISRSWNLGVAIQKIKIKQIWYVDRSISDFWSYISLHRVYILLFAPLGSLGNPRQPYWRFLYPVHSEVEFTSKELKDSRCYPIKGDFRETGLQHVRTREPKQMYLKMDAVRTTSCVFFCRLSVSLFISLSISLITTHQKEPPDVVKGQRSPIDMCILFYVYIQQPID